MLFKGVKINSIVLLINTRVLYVALLDKKKYNMRKIKSLNRNCYLKESDNYFKEKEEKKISI